MPIKTIFIFLFYASFVFAANDDAKELGKMQAAIENLQKSSDKLDSKVDELEKNKKSVEDYKNIIDRQDKRIEDVNSKMASAAEKTSWMAVMFGFLTIIFAILGIAFPIWLNRQNKKAIADAKNEIEQWKEKANSEFEKEIEKIRELGTEKTNEINRHVSDVKNTANESKQKIAEIANKSLLEIQQMVPISGSERREIKEEEQKITQKAEEEQSFDAWSNAMRISLYLGNYGDALQSAEQALFVAENDFEKVIGLCSKGVMLGRFKTEEKSNEAIAVFNKVYEEFGTSQNDAIRLWVAMALVGKGIALEIFKTNEKSNEAIAAYDKVYKEFKTSQDEKIREQVATAMNSKGALQVRLGKNKEAKESYLKAIGFNPSHPYAYINLFELWLINSEEFDENIIKQFLEYAKDDKQALLQYEMIVSIQASLTVEQTERIAELKNKYPDTDFGGWRWDELKTWAETIKDEAAKERVKKTISEFENWGKV